MHRRFDLLIALVILAAPLARAQPCDHHLAHARWDEARARDPHDPVRQLAVTRLLNEALSPGLRLLRELVRQAPSPVLASALRMEPTVAPTDPRHFAGAISARAALGYDGTYSHAFVFPHAHQAPFTPFNRNVMRRLVRAVRGLENLRPALGHMIYSPWREVLNQCAYAGDSFTSQLAVGGDAMLTAVAQLTADPVGSLGPDEILRRITREGSASIVRLSLALPPSVLGPHGGRVFVHDPLVLDGGRLVFSPKYRAFLSRAHAINRKRYRVTFALDHGCPVAHRSGEETTGLQAYVDAVMHLYDAIED